MVVTSAVVPPAATLHWLRGWWRARRLTAVAPPRGRLAASAAPAPGAEHRPAPEAVLLDRDGTLVVDVPYNGDPDKVTPVPGARAAVDRLRAAGLKVAVVSNQSGVGRGLLTDAQVEAVNARIDDLLGPFDGWFVCPHRPEDGCGCRKPAPGLLLAAADALGVGPDRCAVIGDIGADVRAAAAAGARGVLVPTAATRPEEVDAADEVAPCLTTAVERLLAPCPLGRARPHAPPSSVRATVGGNGRGPRPGPTVGGRA